MKSLTNSKQRKLVAARDARVDIALPVAGVLNDVRSAFFGLCVNAGKAVLTAMMEEERVALCGPRGVPNPTRSAYRGGHTRSQVTLAGQRLAIARPRARDLEAGELTLPSFEWAAHRDPLDAATLAAVAAGVSTRRYRTTLDPLPANEAASAVSKSAVSRRFVAMSSERLEQWLASRLDELKLPVAMIDGIHFKERVVLVALGFDTEGRKHALGIREGSTENTRVVRSLIAELIERGLDAETPRLWIIDGGKALRRALTEVFGARALVHRCQEHKRRNVLDHLPENMHASVGRAMKDAWQGKNAALAKRQLERLAHSLAKPHPGAAASLREGLAETLTLTALGIDGALYRTFRTTNPIENLNGLIAHYTRNVKRWRDGDMVLRWVGTALHEASGGFRAVRGFREMKRIVAALEEHFQLATHSERKVA
ncbi:MAG TPA: IS256 family transposase [Casimicrobiaceae bacterium]